MFIQIALIIMIFQTPSKQLIVLVKLFLNYRMPSYFNYLEFIGSISSQLFVFPDLIKFILIIF